MTQAQDSHLNLMSYLKIFFRRKEYIVIPVFLGLIVGICAGIILPKKYISSTILLVEDGKNDNPLFDKLTVSSTVNQRLTTIKESMLGWNSLVKLVKRLGLEKQAKNAHEFEELILGIRKQIDIKLRGKNIIDLSYMGDDPQLTQGVVKNITEIFIERNVEIQNQETADAIQFIEEQLRVYRGKIKSAEIVQLRDQLNALLVDSTEKHPRVKELRDMLRAKEEELRKDNLQFSESDALDSTTTKPIIDEIRKALDNIEGTSRSITAVQAPTKDLTKDAYKLMLIDKLDDVLARDVGVNNDIYNTLLQRAETAKITQRLQTSKEGTKYTVLDPPRLPLRPVRPNKILVALAGVFFGLMLGVGLIFTMEFLDKSFLDVEDANQFLGVPLLGAISKIQTEASVRRQREQMAWLYSLVFLSGVGLVLLTTFLSNLIKTAS